MSPTSRICMCTKWGCVWMRKAKARCQKMTKGGRKKKKVDWPLCVHIAGGKKVLVLNRQCMCPSGWRNRDKCLRNGWTQTKAENILALHCSFVGWKKYVRFYFEIAAPMAQWVDTEAEKSRTERMSVRDRPTWGWFERTDLSDPRGVSKNLERRVIFIF